MLDCHPRAWSPRWLLFLSFLLSLLDNAVAEVPDHRLVMYYQTTNINSSTTANSHVSLLPLIEGNRSSVTHVIVAAVHLHNDSTVHLNDYLPNNTMFDPVWSDVAQLQSNGIVVTAMLGGAAKGSFALLDGDEDEFEHYYAILHDFVETYALQGLDLDVEEMTFSLNSAVRLIQRLRADFGSDFVITLAPVASALRPNGSNLSGFSYLDLEARAGANISFYNAQFYSGFGTPASDSDYGKIMDGGTFAPARVVMGVLTNAANGGAGYVTVDDLGDTLADLLAAYPDFGGVAGWEYFNGLPGPAEWADEVAGYLNGTRGGPGAVATVLTTSTTTVTATGARTSETGGGGDAVGTPAPAMTTLTTVATRTTIATMTTIATVAA